MKNLLLIHGIGGLHRETYFEHLKAYCENIGLNVVMPSLGGYRDGITYQTWKDLFDNNYKSLLNKDTIVLAQSIGTQFIVKYLAENKLKVGAYISCAGPYDATEFRDEIKESAQRFVVAAKTFIPNEKEYKTFNNLPFKKYSFYSNNDCFFEQANLEKYVNAIGSIGCLLPNRSHFSVDGAPAELKEVEEFIKSLNEIEYTEEIFDVYNKNGQLIGLKPKSYCHNGNPGVYHKPVWIWIINDKGQILVQKRAATKKNDPNKYDMPSAGHVDAGETLLQACKRETEEELGLTCKESDFIFLKEWLNQKGWEFAEIYLLKTKAKLTDMKLQKEEVAEVKYLNYDEFIRLFYSADFCDHAKEYKDWVCEVLKQYCK